jgi:DNA invertase Pin-like site-specific DNA recombinase
MKKKIAVYVRVSTNQQKFRSQIPELKRYIKNQDFDRKDIRFYKDKATGKDMKRPGWSKLQKDIESNRISHLIVWRLDRLGRTASGLTALFDLLQKKKVHFESIRDKIDLSTTAGRLIANVLASVAAYETEVRGERVRAGQAAAMAKGKTWGGSEKGRLLKYTPEQAALVHNLKQLGKSVGSISKATGVDKQSVYRLLKRIEEGHLKIG